jgi:paraquat-inducible protein B
MITGKLFINMDFYPDEPSRMVDTAHEYPELPTTPTDLQKIQNTMREVFAKVRELPLEEIVTNIHAIAESVKTLVASPEVTQGIKSLGTASSELSELLGKVNARTEPVATELEGTLREAKQLLAHADASLSTITRGLTAATAEAQGAFGQVRKSLNTETGPAAQIMQNLNTTVQTLDGTLAQTQKTLKSLEGAAGQGSALQYQLTGMLQEISAMARSVRVLSDYLERHPEALLKGKAEEVR